LRDGKRKNLQYFTVERSSEAGKRKLPRLKVSHTGLYLERSIQR
jgi:hypothetical protein